MSSEVQLRFYGEIGTPSTAVTFTFTLVERTPSRDSQGEGDGCQTTP